MSQQLIDSLRPFASVKLSDCRVYLAVDSDGNDALDVIIVLRDKGVIGQYYDWAELEPIRAALVGACRQPGEERKLIVSWILESEMAHMSDDNAT